MSDALQVLAQLYGDWGIRVLVPLYQFLVKPERYGLLMRMSCVDAVGLKVFLGLKLQSD